MSERREIGPELVRRLSLTGELLQENAALRAELEEATRIKDMISEREARLRLTDAERGDIEMWRGECIQQAREAACDGDSEDHDLWIARAERIDALLARLEVSK